MAARRISLKNVEANSNINHRYNYRENKESFSQISSKKLTPKIHLAELAINRASRTLLVLIRQTEAIFE
jgi:hypothetical protein